MVDRAGPAFRFYAVSLKGWETRTVVAREQNLGK